MKSTSLPLDAGGRAFRGFGHRRNAHGLAGRDAVGRFHARAIDPHLAGADQFFDLALGQMRVAAAKPAVDPRYAVVLTALQRSRPTSYAPQIKPEPACADAQHEAKRRHRAWRGRVGAPSDAPSPAKTPRKVVKPPSTPTPSSSRMALCSGPTRAASTPMARPPSDVHHQRAPWKPRPNQRAAAKPTP